MYTAPLAEIKKELQTMDHARLLELCIRQAKYKKENKELLSYILFDSDNEFIFIQNMKTDADVLFEDVNTRSVYLAKKTLRKILGLINRYCKYSGKPETHIEMLMHFLDRMKALPLKIEKNTVLRNMYENQLKKISKLLLTMHEDLQYDYKVRMEGLEIGR